MNATSQIAFVKHTLQAVRAAVKFRILHTSSPGGRPFRPVERLWDIQQGPWAAAAGGTTQMVFRTQTLGEAAPAVFEQESLFEDDRLQREWTVFDLLGQVLSDMANSTASEMPVDYGVLHSVKAFTSSFQHDMESAAFEYRSGDRTLGAVISAPLIGKAAAALNTTPLPRCVRVTGVLDVLRMSNRLFLLNLDDGTKLRGFWTRDSIELRALLGERIVLEGQASYRSSGEAIALQANAARAATEADAPFSAMPVVTSVHARRKLALPGGNALPLIVGKWPGDETDEEIAEFLAALS